MEFLSPGIYIQESQSQQQVTQGVSTSNAAFIGFTPRGPTDEATLVTSYDDYVRKFGGDTPNSGTTIQVRNFYNNAGQQARAFIVRVMPSDAVMADAAIQTQISNQQIETGDGIAAAFSRTSTTTPLDVPVFPESFGFKWRKAAPGAVIIPARSEDEPAPTSADVALVNGTAAYRGQIDPAARLVMGLGVGRILFRSTVRGQTGISVNLVSVALTPSAVFSTVTNTLTVDIGLPISLTAAAAVALINNDTTLTPYVTAEEVVAGLLAVEGPTALADGLPEFDSDLDIAVPDSVQIQWNPDGAGTRIIPVPYVLHNKKFDVIRIESVPADHDTLSISDGIHPPTVFEFCSTAGLPLTTSGSVRVDTDGATEASTRTEFIAAISGVGESLDLTPIAASTQEAGTARLFLVHDLDGDISYVSTFATSTDVDVGTRVQFDYRSGVCSVFFGDTDEPAIGAVGALNVRYIAATADIPTDITQAPTCFSAISTSTGRLVGTFLVPYVAPTPGPGVNYIDYATGAYNITTTGAAIPHDDARIVAGYQAQIWEMTPISKGIWANDLRLKVVGHPDYFDSRTATYTKYTVYVQYKDQTDPRVATDPAMINKFSTLETYEGVDFDDATAVDYFPDVINELSDYINVVAPTVAPTEPINQLSGVEYTRVLIGGDDVTSQVSGVLPNVPIAPWSVNISYRTATGVKTITDDGYQTLTGDIGTIVTPTVDYTSGAIQFETIAPILAGSLVEVTYRTSPLETQHLEVFGDTSKGYTAGEDGTFDVAHYGKAQLTDLSLSATYQGLYALNKIDEIMQVVVPDYAGDVPITKDLLTYASSRASQPCGPDRFIILATPRGLSPQKAVDWFRNTLGEYSKYAALYWPWVNVTNPFSRSRALTVPPMGILAGVYARTDRNKNVGKSPGGTIDGAIQGILGLEYNSTQADRDYVYPNRINPLISTPQTGLAVWGVRSMAGPSQTEWRYINAVRLFMFLGKSIFNSTHWIVFENNGSGLWTRIKGQLDSFMSGLFSQGYFAGNTPAQAFKVVVDATNNPPETIDQGLVFIDVGAAPNKPAEIAVFRLSQLSASAT